MQLILPLPLLIHNGLLLLQLLSQVGSVSPHHHITDIQTTLQKIQVCRLNRLIVVVPHLIPHLFEELINQTYQILSLLWDLVDGFLFLAFIFLLVLVGLFLGFDQLLLLFTEVLGP